MFVIYLFYQRTIAGGVHIVIKKNKNYIIISYGFQRDLLGKYSAAIL